MEFEWDETKSRACFERRGFDFAHAVRTFLDSHRRAGSAERLWRGLLSPARHGRRAGCVVVCTTRGPTVRIISARKANRKEIADYEYNARKG